MNNYSISKNNKKPQNLPKNNSSVKKVTCLQPEVQLFKRPMDLWKENVHPLTLLKANKGVEAPGSSVLRGSAILNSLGSISRISSRTFLTCPDQYKQSH